MSKPTACAPLPAALVGDNESFESIPGGQEGASKLAKERIGNVGTYYEVDDVEKTGQRFYNPIPDQHPSVGKLAAVCDRGWMKFAVDVTSPGEYEEFYSQYKRGLLLSFVLYRI